MTAARSASTGDHQGARHSPRPGAGGVATDARSATWSTTARFESWKRQDGQVQIQRTGPNAPIASLCFKGTHRCSSTGRFRTAPRASDPKTIRFAYSGDETGVSAPGQHKPFWGNFKAFKTMAGEHNDFNIDFGDTIYSDPEVPGAAIARTVRQKWGMYRKKLAVQNMRRIRATTGIYNHWDDHEFINDFSIAEDGGQLYRRSVRAFRDYMPVTYSRKRGIYRSFRWGKNLEMFFRDERSFRSAKASAGGTCDNPDTGQPDLAPTAPQSTRNLFAVIIPSLSQPVSQACKGQARQPQPHPSSARRSAAASCAPSGPRTRSGRCGRERDPDPAVLWPCRLTAGEATRMSAFVLNSLVNHDVDHLVFLTTDTHAAFANVVRKRPCRATSRPPSPRPAHGHALPGLHHRAGRDGAVLERDRRRPVEAGTESFSDGVLRSRSRAASGWSARRGSGTATPR